MTPEQRQQIETQIQSDFSELQKKLENLKNEVQTESDESKKQGKNEEIQILETELAEIKSKMDTLSELHEEEVLALKTRLEEYRAYKQEILDIRKVTPTTYELLKDSATIRGIE
jgi:DNA repair exonuclease SbcCD ATPase subunit